MLSNRQQQVALLVAAGLVNREIGLTLHIGERTVETHVVAILRKLGLRRRTQIATWFSLSATGTDRTGFGR
jgi:DNA-binding NarL/FixJ family response regulator